MCGLTTTTGRDGMGYIDIDIGIDITASHLHETRHYMYQQPNTQPKKHDATTTIYSRYTFMMIPPSFEKDNVFFGWMERERELYNVEK